MLHAHYKDDKTKKIIFLHLYKISLYIIDNFLFQSQYLFLVHLIYLTPITILKITTSHDKHDYNSTINDICSFLRFGSSNHHTPTFIILIKTTSNIEY